MVVETNKIKLVDLRVYRKELGVEVDDEMPKALVYLNQYDGKYHNLLETSEEYPFMKRVPYSNTTTDNISFGTKLLVENPSQIETVGICAIECKDPFIEEVRKEKYRDIKEIEDMILYSDLYFKDRVGIIKRRSNQKDKKRKLARILNRDWERNCHYQDNIFLVGAEIKNSKNKAKSKK